MGLLFKKIKKKKRGIVVYPKTRNSGVARTVNGMASIPFQPAR
jgi:hypothetical protein